MKKLTFLFIMALLPLMASAYDVQVDGIYYNLITTAKLAEVTSGDTKYTGNVTIPESFTYDNGVTYSVTSIGNRAFQDCSGLTSVTIPNSVASIGYIAFNGCSELTEIIIPNGVSQIGWYTFQYCSKLKSVTIGNGVTTIGGYAFDGCSGLTSVTIGNSVTKIGEYAFNDCSGLTEVTIPNSVTSIGKSAFYGCFGLKKVIVKDIAAWCGIKFDDSSSNPLTYAKHLYSDEDTEITNLVIPNSVTSIGGGAFWNCYRLTSVTIPNSVTSIGRSAFAGCSGLTSVTIPNSVTSIGYSAFSGCSSLTDVTIPNSVTSIGDDAFRYCSSLIDIYNYRATPQSIDSYTFSNYSATLHVGKGCKSSYSAANYWKNFTIVEDFDIEINGSCGENAKYSLDTKTGLLSITGTGAMTNYSSESSGPWYPQREFVKEITISEDITSIGSYALYGCSGLTSVTIGNSVTSIGSSAFYGCSDIISIIIPGNVKSIGNSAFANCSELLDVYCYARKGPVTSSDSFYNSGIQFAMLHVPELSVNGYKTTAPWSGFGNIVALQDSDPKPDSGPKPTPEYLRGDVNLDGEIGMPDVMFIVNYILNGKFPDE